jgi:hypothetical protein
VLYELLSGMRLRDGRRPLEDPELDAIVRRAIEAIPKNRYGSARELQAELMAVLDARRTRPRARDLAEFIDRVRSAIAPGTNWDMRSSAVEQHLAAALEAAKRESGDPLIREDTPPATLLIADKGEGEDKDRESHTVVLEESSRPRTRGRPKILALAALAAAAGVGLWLYASHDAEPTATPADRPPAVADRTDDAGTGAVAPVIPRDASPDGGTLADAAPAASEVTPKAPPHPKDDHVRIAPAGPRKAYLSVNTQPWSNMVLDGKAIGETPTKVPLEITPGKHVLMLTNPVSGATRRIEFTVKAGDRKIVSEKL